MPEHFCQTPLYAELLERAYGVHTCWMDGVPFHPRRWSDYSNLALRGWQSIGAEHCAESPPRTRLPHYRGDLDHVRRCETHRTHVVDLSMLHILPDLSKSLGKALRRADRQGVRVRMVEDINDWRENYWPLTWGRGFLWSDKALLYEVQWQYSLGHYAYFVAMEGVEPIAGLGINWWDGCATEILSRVRPEARNLQTQEPLHMEAMRYASAQGCATFDLCPGGTPGIEAFKSKFGGHEEEVVTAWV